MRFRLYPTPAQQTGLVEHCTQARFVWNLALEQQLFAERHRPYRHGRRRSWPNYSQQSAELTEARRENDWLASGSFTVQQQALRDFEQAMRYWWGGTHQHPTWRRKGSKEGFRVVAMKPHHLRRLNRRWGEVLVPKVGRIRFRWTRHIGDVKSYRVTFNASGCWHVCFAKKPEPLSRVVTGSDVGIDRGVVNAIATSDGALLHTPTLSAPERARLLRLQRRLARQQKASGRRRRTKRAIVGLRLRESDQVKDWVEKTTTTLVLANDLIAVENLRITELTRSCRGTVEMPGRNVRAKTSLNREILARRWGLFLRRLRDKAFLAGVVVVQVDAKHTSRRCAACGHVAKKSRESQSRYSCVTCGHEAHADVNAAQNILAAGRAVAARGGLLSGPLNREPQPRDLRAAWLESGGLRPSEDVKRGRPACRARG